MAALPLLKGLPAATPTLLFRIIDRQIRADPILKGAGIVVRSWEGKPEDYAPPGMPPEQPWIRLTPKLGPENWWAQSTQKGPLLIEAEIVVKGTCVDDLLGLWWAIQRAIYPVDVVQRNAFQTRLNQAGAWPGTIAFSPPSLTGGSEGHLEGTGTLTLEYRFDVNPTAPGL